MVSLQVDSDIAAMLRRGRGGAGGQLQSVRVSGVPRQQGAPSGDGDARLRAPSLSVSGVALVRQRRHGDTPGGVVQRRRRCVCVGFSDAHSRGSRGQASLTPRMNLTCSFVCIQG